MWLIAFTLRLVLTALVVAIIAIIGRLIMGVWPVNWESFLLGMIVFNAITVRVGPRKY